MADDLLHRLAQALRDRYRLERELGHGGMGLVFLADDLRHGRKIALKVLRPELAQSIGGDRFLREIRIAAQLTHPNILTLIDSGEVGGFTYYVMPFVEGESLRDRLRREQQLPLDDALQIAREVADALGHAHSLGVIHRDVKPENILFTAGHAVVTDFGIARAISEAGGDKLTESGLVVGTPAYMSPEQASGSSVDARADVYSLACVVYEMLAGDPPYVGATPHAVLARHVGERVPSLRVVRDTVPPAVERAIARGLAKVPADRYATARQFAAALTADGLAATVGAATRGWRRHRALGAAAVVALVALGSYALFGPWGREEGRRVSAGAPRATYAKLTAEPGVEWFPSLSPDGRWIVYSGEVTGNRDIYLQSVGGQNPINLTADSPADDDQPAFSPDGERIAFRSGREGGGLFVMGRTGEGVRRVTREGFKPAWSPDGTQLAYVTENVELNPQNSDIRGNLQVVDIRSGATRELTVTDAALPSWSPHGHRIAYTKRLGTGSERGIWTVPAAGGDEVQATSHAARDWNPAWSPDGAYLYFSSDRGGSMNLWRVPVDERSGRATGEAEPITTPATSLAHITVSGDGRHVAYSSVLVTTNVQRLGFDPDAGTVVGAADWVTTGTRRWSSPDPSPDGRAVAMYTLVQPEGDVYVVNGDGTGLRQVTGGDSTVDRVPRWSPDGQWIAFFSTRSGRLQLWKVRADGSELTQLTAAPHNVGVPAWSPDGSRLAGSAAIQDSGRLVIVDPTRPWAEQVPERRPAPPGFSPFNANAWSPDGTWLAGSVGFGDAGIVVYSLEADRYERLTDVGQWPVWLPDSRRLLYVSGGNAFFVVDRVTKRVQRVYSVTRDVIGPPRLTRDGRHAYFTRRVTEADLWLVTLH